MVEGPQRRKERVFGWSALQPSRGQARCHSEERHCIVLQLYHSISPLYCLKGGLK